MGFLFSGVKPTWEPPEVYVLVPEAHRTGSAWGEATLATFACISQLLDCQIPLGVIHESELALLPREVRMLFWPVPYCPKDEAYARVLEFVRRGGWLYVSGDISYEEATRRRSRTARLIEMCGVEFVGELYPDIRFRETAATRVVAATAEMEFGGGVAYPALAVRPAGATPLLVSEGGEPVVVLHRVGEGRVLYNAEPSELRWSVHGPPVRGETDLYRWFLRGGGVSGLPVEPREADVRAMRVPTEDRGEVYVFMDLAESGAFREVRLRGVRGEYTLGLRDQLPGAIHLDRRGRVLAVEAGREFRAGGETVAEASGPFMVVSLDRIDVRISKALAVVPFRRGEFAIRSAARWVQPVLEVGEVVDGGWKTYEGILLRPEEDGTLRFRVNDLQELEMLVICEQGKEKECGDLVARRILHP